MIIEQKKNRNFAIQNTWVDLRRFCVKEDNE